MFARIAGAKARKQLRPAAFTMQIVKNLRENSHNFSYSRLNTFHGSTLVAVVTNRLFVG